MTARAVRLFATLFAVILIPLSARGHEVRPGYLEIRETASQVQIFWKQPVIGDRTIAIRPTLSSGWLQKYDAETSLTSDALTRVWRIPVKAGALEGQTVAIAGLERTITDVLLRIQFADGREVIQILKPEHPSLVIPNPAKSSIALGQYFKLGIDHIWSGFDHLLFILALVILIHEFRRVIVALTAFTVAHSITLGATTLGWIKVSPAPVEAVIALSIVYLGVEIIRQREGRTDWAGRWPWLIAFVFGLLHGFGFAGALRDIGLPEGNIPAALLFFNLGIEAGQIAFIGAVGVLFIVLRALLPRVLSSFERLSPYLVGSIASYWLIVRVLAIVQI